MKKAVMILATVVGLVSCEKDILVTKQSPTEILFTKTNHVNWVYGFKNGVNIVSDRSPEYSYTVLLNNVNDSIGFAFQRYPGMSGNTSSSLIDVYVDGVLETTLVAEVNVPVVYKYTKIK